MIKILKEHFLKLGFKEKSYTPFSNGMSCCEDAKTAYRIKSQHNDIISFLPQTRQMDMELDVRNGIESKLFTCDWSHRDEPRSGDGRHENMFQLMEYEFLSDFLTPENRLKELLLFNWSILNQLQSGVPLRVVPYMQVLYDAQNEGIINNVVYGMDISPDIEIFAINKYGDGVSPIMIHTYPEVLCHFTMAKSPIEHTEYWRFNELDFSDKPFCQKVDVIVPRGGEAMGTAVRSTDPDYLKKRLYDSDMYSGLLKLGMKPEAFDKYINSDLTVPTIGGGIGIKRMKKWIDGEIKTE